MPLSHHSAKKSKSALSGTPTPIIINEKKARLSANVSDSEEELLGDMHAEDVGSGSSPSSSP